MPPTAAFELRLHGFDKKEKFRLLCERKLRYEAVPKVITLSSNHWSAQDQYPCSTCKLQCGFVHLQKMFSLTHRQSEK